MNRIFKVVWNSVKGCFVVGSEFVSTKQCLKGSQRQRIFKSARNLTAAVLLSCALGLPGLSLAEVQVADQSKHGGTVTSQGNVYNIENQETKGNRALNQFEKFNIEQNKVANLQLRQADHQINIVKEKMNVDGVVNAIKNNKIGGDVYFFSDKGIAIGKTGVINVGRLTLGTNADYGEKLYEDGLADYNKLSALDKAKKVGDDKDISIEGKIYAQGDVLVGTDDDLTVKGAIHAGLGDQSRDALYTDAETARKNLMNLEKVTSANKVQALGNGNVTLYAGDTLKVQGTANNPVNIKSLGGKINLASMSSVPDIGADSDEEPEHAYISIKNAYLDSGANNQNSGDIEISAVRDAMGVSRVDVDDSTIDAAGKNGQRSGDVTVKATTETQLMAWDLLDGAYAQVKMGKKGQERNTIKGDNVTIAADASTRGDIGEENTKTEAEISQEIEAVDDDNGIISLVKDLGGNLRPLATVTNLHAKADVDIEKTDISALGENKNAEQDKHGNLSITSDARSTIQPISVGLVNYGFNVGIGDIDSHVNIDNSNLYADRNINIDANGNNKVGMSFIEMNFLDSIVRSTVNFSWAQLASDISAKVGKDAVLTSGNDTNLTATSTRELSSSVSNGGDTNIVGLAASVALADTKATAEMAGTVYAGGDVKVKAENTLAQDKGGVYKADTSRAASMSGMSGLKETVDLGKGTAIKGGKEAWKEGKAAWGYTKKGSAWVYDKTKTKYLVDSLKHKLGKISFIKKAADKHHRHKQLEILKKAMQRDLDLYNSQKEGPKVAKKPWNKLGLNGATALLASSNDSTAAVTGKVRGLAAARNQDGLYLGDDKTGAKSLEVNAHTLSRSAAKTGVYQADPPDEAGVDRKSYTVTAGLTYLGQQNGSKAYISGDTKTIGDTTVKAKTEIPWQTKWQSTDLSTQLMNTAFTAISGDSSEAPSYLVDSWTQASGDGKTANGAGSFAVINYANSATAFIGKDDDQQTSKPQVDAGGQVDVDANTDITTVNFTGSIPNFTTKAPINLWKNLISETKAESLLQAKGLSKTKATEFWNKRGFNGDDASKAGIGGAVQVVRQANTTDAYIDDDAVVKAKGDVDVDAKTEAHNLAFSAAGGQAESVALDATIGAELINDETNAHIGNATVNAGKNVNVKAEDFAVNVNASGAGAVTQGAASIGATVGYNHIVRDTTATIKDSTITAGNDVDVQAKNSGEIIAASVAGSVAYDNPAQDAKNAAGSTGFHEVDGTATPATSEDENAWGLRELFQEVTGEDIDLNQKANENIKSVTGKDSSMKDNAAQTKNSLAAAANVAVNRIVDTAKATVDPVDSVDAKEENGQEKESASKITADSLSVTAKNDSGIYAVSGAIAAGLDLSANTQSVAGSFMYNAITGTNEASVNGADLTLTGKKDDQEENPDTSLLIKADNDEKIVNIAGSGSGAARGNAVAGQVSLNWVDDNTKATLTDSTVKAKEKVEVDAVNAGKINSYTGSVAVSSGGQGLTGNAVGAAVGVNLIQGDTEAKVENTAINGTADKQKAGDVQVKAEEKSDITSAVASGAAGTGLGASFSANANYIGTTTTAKVDSAKAMQLGKLNVEAANTSAATLGTGALSLGNNAAGAAIGVMINDATVTAQLTGDQTNDKTKANQIAADGISVTANNAYNDSAADSDEDSKAKNVAIGAAGGVGTFAGSGSVTVNVIKQKTQAEIGQGNYDAGNKDVKAKAITQANVFGLAGGLSLSGGTGIGAAIDVQHYTGNTQAGIADGVQLSKAKSVTVNADSSEKMTSVGATLAGGSSFGGAGAAGAHSVSTDTRAYIGNAEDKSVTDKEKANLENAGDVQVTAKDGTTLKTAAGAGSGGGTAGGGFSAAVEVVDKTVDAHVGNQASVKGQSLQVKAENTSNSTTASAGLGVGGTAGLAGAASETFANHDTKAYVGKNAVVEVAGNTDITASSSFTQKSGAGGAAIGGTAAAGLGNATVKLDADTQAYIDQQAQVTSKGINLKASQATDITYATIAGTVAGSVAVNGAVSANVLDTTTKAYAGAGSKLTATAGSISLSAEDTTKLKGGNGGAAIAVGGTNSVAGLGAAVGVNTVKKDAEAYVDKNASLNSADKISLQADTSEDITAVTVQGSGGLYAGIAGAANGTNLDVTTKAFTNTGVKINQNDEQKGGDISLDAKHEVKKMLNTVIGASGGIGAIGAAVDVGVIRTQTNAYLGDQNQVKTQGQVGITATDNMHDITSTPYAGAIGGVGLSGSLSVYDFGSGLSKEDQALLSGKNEKGQETGFNTWADGQLNSSQTQTAMNAYDTGALKEVKQNLQETKFSAAATETKDTAGEKGTLAKIGKDTTIDAAGNVTVKADDTVKVNPILGNISGGSVGAVGATVSVVHADTQTKARIDDGAQITAGGDLSVTASSNHTVNSILTGASVSAGVAGQGTVSTWNDKANVYAQLGDTKGITAKNIKVDALNQHTLNANVVGASVALWAANGAVANANVAGVAEASVGNTDNEPTYDGEVKATQGDVTVSSQAKTKLEGRATGAAAGIYSATGTGISLNSNVDARTKIGQGEKLSGQKISITASNTPQLDAEAISAGVGLAAVGATVAETNSQDDATVEVADKVTLKAADDLTLKAELKQPEPEEEKEKENTLNYRSSATAGSGGVVAGSVSVAGVETDQTTATTVGQSATLSGKTIHITADHQDIGNVQMNSVSVGYGASGTGGDTRYTVDSENKVDIGDGTSLTSSDDTTVLAHNETKKQWADGNTSADTATSAGAALASGNGVVNHTKITHQTAVNLGKVTMKANAPELTADKDLRDTKAIAIDAQSAITSYDNNTLATGAAVGAAHVKNTNEATAETSVTVAEGAILQTGDVTAAKAEHKDTFDADMEGKRDASYRGGSIGIGTKNDADLYSSTLVDVFGAAGYAGSTNDVTYTATANTTFNGSAETAKGDIRTAAGRDSDGKAGKQSVSAHSDILNATAIPISIPGDPVAEVKSTAKLSLGNKSDLASDRDIYLQSNAGKAYTSASGEIKDWVNKVGAAFGSEGHKLGKTQQSTTADANLQGKVQTGIHRNRFVKFWGEPEKDKAGKLTGKWILYTERNGDISYEVSGQVPVGTDLFSRLDELDNLQGDEKAMAAYAAERKFIENKLVEQGLGYYNGKQFVRTPVNEKSEFDQVKDMLTENSTYRQDQTKLTTAYQATKTKLDNQSKELNKVQTAYTIWQDAVSSQQAADKALTDARNAVANGDKDFDAYVKDNPDNEQVKAYQTAKDTKDTADLAVTNAVSAYGTAASTYDTAYGTQFNTTLSAALGNNLSTEKTELDGHIQDYGQALNLLANDLQNRENQLKATSEFFKNGGTENTVGEFFYKDGQKVIGYRDIPNKQEKEAVPGYYQYDGNYYYLLHKNTYNQMTRNLNVGDIEATLGDIHLEGDNVYGTGTLSAPGDATVQVTNATPYNLKVNDITVAGRGGTKGVGKGGRIFLNDTALNGTTSQAINAAIQKKNRDAGKTVAFKDVQSKNTTDKPSVTIEGTFVPTDYKNDGDNQPLFTAPTLTVEREKLIYNPNGSVTVTSANGDVYNKGSINGGTISVNAGNGDFIQSYNPNQRMANIGGTPLNDEGGYQNEGAGGMGILANGNVFISARYVNINGTIQSGIADWTYTIPQDYTLYYLDGDQQVTVSEADAKATPGRQYLVADSAGKALNKNGTQLTYDAAKDCFVLDNIDVNGGHVSIVGTIINTAQKGAEVGKVRALDGYGKISVTNNSGKNLELRNLNTGDGVEGSISLTDLDKTTGKVRQTVVYTRSADGKLHQKITNADGQLTETELDGNSTTYKTDAGMYYALQTGRDSSETKRYELHKKAVVDWFGISDRTPTLQDLLDAGGKQTAYYPGEEKVLHGGYYVSDTPTVGQVSSQTDEYTQSSTTYQTNQPTDQWKEESSRKWYYLGLAKDWDVTLDQTTYNRTIKQYSVKADHPVGIEFFGDQKGGTLEATSDKANIQLSGTLSNVGGTTSLSAKNISQTSGGLINTDNLGLTASGSVGSKDQAITTTASTLSGKAGGDFNVLVQNHGVTVNGIEAGQTLNLTAADGISQKADTNVKAQRINLAAGSGAITGANDGDFQIQAGAGSGADYGLKATAQGDIAITNSGNDLYLDSVTSADGNVRLTTTGSFVDNNFTDTDNASAKEKLQSWADKAVLASRDMKSKTVTKQKNLLKSKVQEKYNEFQNLKAYVNEDGQYTLSDTAKAALMKDNALKKAGYDSLAAYVQAKQKRYDELKDSVGTWKKADVDSYLDKIEQAKDAQIYGNASLTKDQLASDTFLTQDEKANILVGSAKSPQDLLVTFTSAGIKEGITDTRTTLKQTPHVTGQKVTLKALGKGEVANSGNIGTKTIGQTIDLSDDNIDKLTSDELVNLAAAERGDFTVNGQKVTLSSVRAIDALATGALQATAEHGSIYLNSPGSLVNGSTVQADGEIRVKADTDLNGLTVTNKGNGQVILEAGKGSISNLNLKGSQGTLTARAKKGIDLSKAGDLTVHTLYAADGDVQVDLQNKGSLYAEDGNDQSTDEQGTTYVNIEGKNITIKGARNIVGAGEKTNSVGLKLTQGTSDSTGTDSTKDTGTIQAETGQADVTLFGAVKDANIKANQLQLTNRGNLAAGSYTSTGDLKLHNAATHETSGAPADTISGGTFTGQTVNVDNQSKISDATISGSSLSLTNNGTLAGGSYTSTGKLEVTNTGKIENGNYQAADALNLTNSGTLTGGTYNSQADLTVTNSGTLKDGKFTGQQVNVNNQKNITASSFTAKGEDTPTTSALTYTDTADATLADTSLKAEKGSLALKDSKGKLENLALQAAKDVTVDAAQDASFTNVAAANVTLTSKGSLTAGKVKSTGKTTLTSANDQQVTSLQADQAELTSTAGDVHLNQAAVTQDLTVQAGQDATLNEVTSGEALTVQAGHNANVTNATAGRAALTAANDLTSSGRLQTTTGDLQLTATKGQMKLNQVDAAQNLTAHAGGSLQATQVNAGQDANLDSREDMQVTDLTAQDNATLASGDNLTADHLTTKHGDLKLQAEKGQMQLNQVQAAGNLQGQAEKDITFKHITSADLDLKAGGNILGETPHASINAADIKLQAGDKIRLSDRERVQKLTGVDLNGQAGNMSGSSNKAGHLRGQAKGSGYDPSKKGSASLNSSTGQIQMQGKTIEMDQLQSGKSSQIKATVDHLGIDDIQSQGSTTLEVNGLTSDQTRYAGLHVSSQPATLKNSKIETLDFTGTDQLGVVNSQLGSNSRIATEKASVTLTKNKGNKQAMKIGSLQLSGYDLSSSEPFASVNGGLSLNGAEHPLTAESVANRNLYSHTTELGDDGRKKEEKENQVNDAEITFAPVTTEEKDTSNK